MQRRETQNNSKNLNTQISNIAWTFLKIETKKFILKARVGLGTETKPEVKVYDPEKYNRVLNTTNQVKKSYKKRHKINLIKNNDIEV